MSRSRADGGPILARNIFDSATGPLDRDGRSTPAASGADAPADPATDGLVTVPRCADGSLAVHTTLLSIDRARSIALLSSGGGSKMAVNEGATFAGRAVRGIGWRQVFLADGAGFCYLDVFGGGEPLLLDPAELGLTADEASRAVVKAPITETEKSHLTKFAVETLGADHFGIEKAVFARPLERMPDVLGAVRGLPHTDEDGVVDGYTVHGVRRGSLLAQLGVENGDLVRRVAGAPLNGEAGIAVAYRLVQKGGRVVVELERSGTTRQLTFEIR